MRSNLQSEINPYTPPATGSLGAAKKPTAVQEKPSDVDFLSVINNSNSDVKRERQAKELNGGLSGAETYDEFLKKISEKDQQQRVPKNNLDKDDFLKLFVTQLQHQDPLNPEDGTEMASRLAHFNSLEQMMNVNKTLNSLLDTQKESRSVDLVNYIGKEVEIKGGRIKLEEGASAEGTYKLARPATDVTLEVRDASGTVVHTRKLGSVSEGEQSITWDGKKLDGTRMSSGVYNFSVFAKGINGEDVPVDLVSKAKISGVDLQDKEGLLYSNLGNIKFDQIRSIGVAGFEKDKPAEVAPEKTEAKPSVPQVKGPAESVTVKGNGPSPEMLEQIIKENAQAAGLQIPTENVKQAAQTAAAMPQ